MARMEERLATLEQWKKDFIPTFQKFECTTDVRLQKIEQILSNGIVSGIKEISDALNAHIENSEKKEEERAEKEKAKKDRFRWVIRAFILAALTTFTSLMVAATWALVSGYAEKLINLMGQ
jgi:hypothetical protein